MACWAFRCAQSLELTQMAKKGAHFRCPQHYCAVCQKSGDGVDMVKCIRCPTAYHSSCMPKDIQRLLPHAKVSFCCPPPPSSTDTIPPQLRVLCSLCPGPNPAPPAPTPLPPSPQTLTALGLLFVQYLSPPPLTQPTPSSARAEGKCTWR